MNRQTYLIAQIDHVLVPSTIAYVGHCETPYDLRLRFTPFRDSATIYSAKRDAIKKAKRLSQSMNRYQWAVIVAHDPFHRNTRVWESGRGRR